MLSCLFAMDLLQQVENALAIEDVSLSLTSKNPDALASFYASVFKVEFATLMSLRGPEYHHGKLGVLKLIIRCDEVRESNDEYEGVSLAFTMKGIEKVYRNALAHGATPVAEPGEFLSAQFRDPDGNLIEIVEALPF